VIIDAPIRLHSFHGGLHLDDRKSLATGEPIGEVALPARLILPLAQHIGGAAKPCVVVGDHVRRGQTVAEAQGVVSSPIHAPTSGRIVALEARRVPHPSGLTADCLVLEPDGLDQPLEAPEWQPFPDFTTATSEQIRAIARAAGIVGLGGAAFPSAIKLNPGRVVDTLIINGAECEPYISCDQMLMTEQAGEIVLGIQVVMHALAAPRCLVGIEDNKPDAIRAMSKAAETDTRISVVVVPTRYPQGGEKQLIQTLTGMEVPSEGLPLDLGIVCHNPGTVRAVGRAVCFGEPLIERIITVTGEAIARPRNLRVRLGTLMSYLVEQVGGFSETPGRVLMGGPMMGFALPELDVPVIKATNCVLALASDKIRPTPEAQPCIRCGECVTVCPSRLLPQQLYWHARAREFETAENLNLFDCIECGCCAIVCPSHIPLVQYYRFAKTEIHAAESEKRLADAARVRHESRQARIEREERAKEDARARKKAALAAKASAPAATRPEPAPASSATPAPSPAAADDPVAVAMARAQARRAANNAVPAPASVEPAENGTGATSPPAAAENDPVAQAIAAAKARKAAKAAAEGKSTSPEAAQGETPADDPVARAMAAAQARKAAKAAAAAAPDEGQGVDDSDPVAKAIAAAKARKAAKAVAEAAPASTPPAADTAAEDDPVAKAIAAAKARKAARDAAGKLE
jgi:Na+-translocating ferredoxin:NAD+ oxidoreductase subunit C